jgi:hypothetical protein
MVVVDKPAEKTMPAEKTQQQQQQQQPACLVGCPD